MEHNVEDLSEHNVEDLSRGFQKKTVKEQNKIVNETLTNNNNNETIKEHRKNKNQSNQQKHQQGQSSKRKSQKKKIIRGQSRSHQLNDKDVNDEDFNDKDFNDVNQIKTINIFNDIKKVNGHYYIFNGLDSREQFLASLTKECETISKKLTEFNLMVTPYSHGDDQYIRVKSLDDLNNRLVPLFNISSHEKHELVIYFAGHGGNGCIALGLDNNKAPVEVRLETILKVLNEPKDYLVITFILDSCEAGSMVKWFSENKANYQKYNFCVIASCLENEKSFGGSFIGKQTNTTQSYSCTNIYNSEIFDLTKILKM